MSAHGSRLGRRRRSHYTRLRRCFVAARALDDFRRQSCEMVGGIW
jgi:hypothetical protein